MYKEYFRYQLLLFFIFYIFYYKETINYHNGIYFFEDIPIIIFF